MREKGSLSEMIFDGERRWCGDFVGDFALTRRRPSSETNKPTALMVKGDGEMLW